MSDRKGGSRLAPRKKPAFLSVLVPVLALLLVGAAIYLLLSGPESIFSRSGGKETVSASPGPGTAEETAAAPSAEPERSPAPTLTPTPSPSASASAAPSSQPSPAAGTPSPSPEASPEPSAEPSPEPSAEPSPSPEVPDKPEGEEKDSEKKDGPPHPPVNGDIYSACALLTDRDTGRVLYVNNADTRSYPASLTKILTAVTVLDSGADLDSYITFTSEMLEGLEDASVAGYEEGDSATVRELLYGLMVPSGADCANALAFTLGGSIEGFADMMNDCAAWVGMTHSHFTNPSGLHDPDQYTTARDLTALLEHALEYPVFAEIFTTAVYTLSPTDSSPEGITVRNYILASPEDLSFGSGSIRGAKTGFTTPAGQCLASIATTDSGARYMLVTMGAGREFDFDYRYSLEDARHLYALAASGGE